jgi:uncharacterized membrane protein YdjX (TVP38/TMEM64 family)
MPEPGGHRPAMSEPVPAVPADSTATAAVRRLRLVKFAAVALVLLVGAGLIARGYDIKGAIEQALAIVRSAGPVVFFLAMALLPAVGAPQSIFTLSAGSLFAADLGMTTVVGLGLLAIVVNMILSYWLASRVLRPLLEALLTRLGYKIPQVQKGDENGLIVVLRVTPGVPFPVQNYLLGLARVGFVRYLLISSAIQGPLNAAFIIFGNALLNGKGKTIFIGLSLIVALLAGTALLRKHYGKKRA